MSAIGAENVSWQNTQHSRLTILRPEGYGTATASDIFQGTDTYGWPPEDDVWSPPGRSNVLLLVLGLIVVPDVTGLTVTAATNLLGSLTLVAVPVGAYSTNYALGTVFNQFPSAGSTVHAGASVTITYSLGPPPAPPCLPAPTQQAGFGGDKWGASGGSATPINAAQQLGPALSTGVQPANALDVAPNRSVMSEASNSTLPLSSNACLVPDTPQVG